MSEHKIKTTVVGSFPSRPSGNAFMKNYREGGDPYLASLEDAVNNQVASGIDIISDGQTRNDMVSLFATKLKGIRMKARPVIIGPVEFREPVALDDLKFARELMGDGVQLKGIITGAYTMARSCIDEYYGNLEELSFAFADALAEEAKSISEVVDVIQVDEPFFSVDHPEYSAELVNTILKGVNGEVGTAMHVCGDIESVFEKLVEIKVDVLDHEFAAHDGLAEFIAGYDFPQQLGYGCVRSDINEVESVDIVKERIKKGLDLFSKDKLLLDPDCGLRQLDRSVAIQKLRNMVEARDLIEQEV
ncbi:MAG: methionine synthase [Thermoplasmata archaeon]|nr:methionine synthase [Thermoplasmata archaeon]